MVSLFLLRFLTISCEIALPTKRNANSICGFLAQWVRERAWAGSGGFQRKGEPGYRRRVRLSNDNVRADALFRCAKYRPESPARGFDILE